jgi:hypothetical protein
MAKERLPVRDAEGALYFALRFAEPAATERIFQGYLASAGGKADPGIVQAHRERQESARRLLELWPSLEIRLPKL